LSHRVLPSFPTRRSSDLFGAGRDVNAAFDVVILPEAFSQAELPVFESLARDLIAGALADTEGIVGRAPDRFNFHVVLAPSSRARSEEHTSELQSPCNLVC